MVGGTSDGPILYLIFIRVWNPLSDNLEWL